MSSHQHNPLISTPPNDENAFHTQNSLNLPTSFPSSQTNSQSERQTLLIQQSQPLNKTELLRWLSQEINIQVNNIQRVSSGTLIILLFVKIFQNDVQTLQAIHKSANIKAKAEIESLTNFKFIFKLLQEQISQAGVNWIGSLNGKPSAQVDFMNKLIKGKVNELVEILQIVKKFYDGFKPIIVNNNNHAQCQKIVTQMFDDAQIMGIDNKKSAFQDSTNFTRSQYSSNAGGYQYKSIITDYSQSNTQNNQSSCNNVLQFEKLLTRSYQVQNDLESLIQDNQELRKLNVVQQVRTKAAEKERDFYFGKLRDIELLLTQEEGLAQKEPEERMRAIVKILYAKEDENIEVDEDGNIIV
ncbi:microtubule-associated rp eb member 2 [Stylonychia lemnae]|uniref:Microtubule-associated rp eb member 2 n=1 Tax=Stylonychia lemnae TaxID=5949 RepID=A0A078ARY1_STYLE|nr:microtubule-associated rp eb member 2 [Stylonychia lemnae]|eukprot:CDW83952.1 microtubule-associated rp eb member 2 [Stylonychia lemnae]